MSPRQSITLASIAAVIALSVFSCSHYDIEKAEKKISRTGDDESHYTGQNCMNCHKTGGKGEGWFTIGGSVYKADKSTPNPNGKVYLYTDPDGQGTLKYTLEVDALGNFYTTETINFEGGLYPVHENSAGKKQYMQTPILTGQCQSCHNATTDVVWNE